MLSLCSTRSRLWKRVVLRCHCPCWLAHASNQIRTSVAPRTQEGRLSRSDPYGSMRCRRLPHADTAHLAPCHSLHLQVDDYPFINREPSRRRRPNLLRRRSTPPSRPTLPLFSHYQTTAHSDILCPGGSFREGRYDQLMLCGRSFYTTKWPWRQKRNVGFWRGHPYCGKHVFDR